MDPRDLAVQSVTPTVMVPRFGDFKELRKYGQRMLAAANGTWFEANRPWLYVRLPVAPAPLVPVPYGEVTQKINFRCGKLPKALVLQFIAEARKRIPNECAGWIVWNSVLGNWKLLMLEELKVGHDHVSVALPVLLDNEHLVIDIHSHGLIKAFFSDEDNFDDMNDYKISIVVGNLNEDIVTAEFRLCVNGLFMLLPSMFTSPSEVME